MNIVIAFIIGTGFLSSVFILGFFIITAIQMHHDNLLKIHSLDTDFIRLPKKPTSYDVIDTTLSNEYGHSYSQHRLNKAATTLEVILYSISTKGYIPFDFIAIDNIALTELNRIAFTPEFEQLYNEMIASVTAVTDDKNDDFSDIWSRR